MECDLVRGMSPSEYAARRTVLERVSDKLSEKYSSLSPDSLFSYVQLRQDHKFVQIRLENMEKCRECADGYPDVLSGLLEHLRVLEEGGL